MKDLIYLCNLCLAYPFQSSNETNFHCAGTIVTRNWILTSVACCDHSETTKIIAGQNDLQRNDPTDIEIEEIFQNETYCLAKVRGLEIDGDSTEEVCLADNIESMLSEQCFTASWNDEHSKLSSSRRRS